MTIQTATSAGEARRCPGPLECRNWDNKKKGGLLWQGILYAG
jgi:hypothetical protein